MRELKVWHLQCSLSCGDRENERSLALDHQYLKGLNTMRNTTKKKHVWQTFFIILVLLHLCALAAYRGSRNAEILTVTQQLLMLTAKTTKTDTWQTPTPPT